MIHTSKERKKIKTRAERYALLAEYKRLLEPNQPTDDIDDEFTISASTLRRWDDQKRSDQRLSQRYGRLPLIERAIETLLAPEQAPLAERLLAVFRFWRWLRWPEQDDDNAVAVVSCFASYYRQKFLYRTLSDLDEKALDVLNNLITMRFLEAFCDPDFFVFPVFEEDIINEDDHSKQDAIVEVIKYMCTDPVDRRYRKRHSLTKASDLLRNGDLDVLYDVGPQAFWKLWVEYGSSSPFLLVERIGGSSQCDLNFHLDPFSSDFVENVDDLLAGTDEFRAYFSRCKWVIDRLHSRFDAKSWNRLLIPRLPADLPLRDVEL